MGPRITSQLRDKGPQASSAGAFGWQIGTMMRVRGKVDSIPSSNVAELLL